MGPAGFTVRPAATADAGSMAAVHVECWRQTYRGLMSDAVLEDPEAYDRRLRMWTALLTEQADRKATVAVRAGTVVGIALSGPPDDVDVTWDRQLFVLYVMNDCRGTGVAATLVAEVLAAEVSAALWVADPNPRAPAFYEKLGFVRDGHATTASGVPEVRMVRA